LVQPNDHLSLSLISI